ncbi:MAG TPA: type I phosphomannose isomerase catalytic subunit [Planctomicrobium sp.]|nr:type I phosphomannose isomerase catalytic subunit [Planctomicrobium sp.]
MTLSLSLRFEPLLKRALWGGTRLQTDLGKVTGGDSDVAESWEVCDLPGSVSRVSEGPLAGRTLRQLMEESSEDLLGKHRDHHRFPLLVKFLDAHHQLSVQVHPNKPVLHSDGTLRPGKAEFWVVIDALPESRMYIGLRPGVTEQHLRQAVVTGTLEECLHVYHPKIGDCIYLEPGTVHALGGGLLVAEIQQPSDVTYRFYDWDRTDSQGNSRELHVEQSFAATNFDIGPVQPVVPRPLPGQPGSEVLVESPHFVIHRRHGRGNWSLPKDDKMHVLIVLAGTVRQSNCLLVKGQTAVVPAARTESVWDLNEDAIVLDAFLPDESPYC